MIMRLICFVVLVIVLLPCEGRAMAAKPNEESLRMDIDLSDGVNKEEAIYLAKGYLIKKGLEQNVVISRPKVKESRLIENCWVVYFPPSVKIGGLFSFVIEVDKTTGEIKLAGWGK